jgi:copper(I)-binding protein
VPWSDRGSIVEDRRRRTTTVGVPDAARPSSRPGRRRGRGVAVVAALACVALSGCGADFNAQTNQQYQAGVGTDNRDNQVYVLGALVVARDSGEGTLVGTLINQVKTTDALVSVTSEDADGQPITATSIPQPITLTNQKAVKLQTGGTVHLSGPGVVLGDVISVTFSFQQAAPIKLDVPVVAYSDIYSGIPVATPSGATAGSSNL